MSKGKVVALSSGKNKYRTVVFAKLKNGAVYAFKQRVPVEKQEPFGQRIVDNDYEVQLKYWVQVKDRSGKFNPVWADALTGN